MDVSMFDRALKTTAAVVAGTKREQFDEPTPCTDWSVRDVLNHIVGGLRTYISGAAGTAVEMSDGTDYTAKDHAAEFDRAAAEILEILSAPDIDEKKFTLPWGESPTSMVLPLAIADAAVHGWDLARGTDQEYAIDDDIAEAVHAWTSQMMEPNGNFPRGDSFGPIVEVPDNAPAVDRMVAYLGRRP
jgi:uncharacterized protein (TIGR03086 family)